jgi:hypothetical protein
MALRDIIYTAGQKPALSWSRFKHGLLIFALGTVILLASQHFSELLYWPGFFVVVVGFIVAMRGYWGLFANRFAQLIEQKALNAKRDPYASLDKKPKQD